MTIIDRDIYASAQLFIKKHGDAALIKAMNKEEHFAQNGNLEAARTWHRIADAIEWLQMPQALSDKTCH